MISFIVPSIGRPSLAAAVASIETWPGDEVLVIGSATVDLPAPVRWIPCEPGHDWGCTERRIGIQEATQPYLAFLDDDDRYAPGHRALMQSAIDAAPDQPAIFRMRYAGGVELWQSPRLTEGNIGTPMLLVPNDPLKLGTWTPRYEGDFDFLTSSKWTAADYQWRPEVIAWIRH